MIINVVLVFSVYSKVVQLYMYLFFFKFFSHLILDCYIIFRLLHNIEQRSLCHCWLSILSCFLFFFFNFLFCLGVWPINHVTVVSGEQQRDSAIHTLYLFSPKLLSHPAANDIEQSSVLLVSRSSLVVHFNYSSVCMSVPHSLATPSLLCFLCFLSGNCKFIL